MASLNSVNVGGGNGRLSVNVGAANGAGNGGGLGYIDEKSIGMAMPISPLPPLNEKEGFGGMDKKSAGSGGFSLFPAPLKGKPEGGNV